MILHARVAKGRGFALLLFFVQLAANFAWSPLFFGRHQVTSALFLIIFMLMVTVATAFAFAPIRKAAAWLLVPYMAWLGFATVLTFQIDQRNPDAETLVPHAARTQIGCRQGASPDERSEERRGGNGCVSTVRSRGSPY